MAQIVYHGSTTEGMMEKPHNFTTRNLVLLDSPTGHPTETLTEDGRFRVVLDWGDHDLGEVQVCYRDYIAVAECTHECLAFSHWFYIPGGNPRDREPVWTWKLHYRVIELYRVGRGGVLNREG